MMDTAALGRLNRALKVLQDDQPIFPTTYAILFIEVVIWHETNGDWPLMKDLERRLGISQSAFSRAAGALSSRRQHQTKDRPGNWEPIGWLEKTEDPTDTRAKRLKLTREGAYMATLVNDIMAEKPSTKARARKG